jgi:hypothetical protein
MKVVRLSALHTGHLYPPGNNSGTHFSQRLVRLNVLCEWKIPVTPPGIEPIILVYSAVPQPTVPPHAPNNDKYGDNAKIPEHIKIVLHHQVHCPKTCNCTMKLQEMLTGVMLFDQALQSHDVYGVEWDERTIINPKSDNCSWFMEDTMNIAHSSWEIKKSNHQKKRERETLETCLQNIE